MPSSKITEYFLLAINGSIAKLYLITRGKRSIGDTLLDLANEHGHDHVHERIANDRPGHVRYGAGLFSGNDGGLPFDTRKIKDQDKATFVSKVIRQVFDTLKKKGKSNLPLVIAVPARMHQMTQEAVEHISPPSRDIHYCDKDYTKMPIACIDRHISHILVSK